MKPKIDFKIFPKLKIVLVYYQGKINAELIIKHLDALSSHKDYNDSYNFITDLSHCNLNLDNKEFKTFVDYFINSKSFIGPRKQAVIAKTSNQKAVSSLFAMSVRNMPIKINIVDTIREAYEWIDLETKQFDFISHQLDLFLVD